MHAPHLFFKVIQAIENRVGAKMIPEVPLRTTPKEQFELFEMSKISGFVDRAVVQDANKKDRVEVLMILSCHQMLDMEM